MKCEDVSKGLIAYLDARANSAERGEVDEHLKGCAACRTRVAEFREISGLLGEVPAIEPSLGFDARVRERVAAEPRRRWFSIFAPQPRLAFAGAGLLAVLTIALTLWVVKMPPKHPVPSTPVATATTDQQEDFNAIKDLGVLENYEVLTKFDALSAGTSSSEPESGKAPQGDATAND